jgi:hypothetical protein
MRAADSQKAVATTATADNPAFVLEGGRYLFVAHVNAGSALTAGLGMLSADGTNFVSLFTALAHVSGVQALDLPPGKYQFLVTGTPGGGETYDLSVSRVPYE